MCIIIYKPAGITLFPETMRNSFEHNKDGAGFAYVEDGKITVEKGFFTFKSFETAFKPHEKKQALLHFRIKTHGDYSEENCHPFHITTNAVFAHNGIIYRMPYDQNKSDTALFNELVLQNLVRVYGKRILFDSVFKGLLEGYTMNSKLVFLDNSGKFTIINEKDGEWNSNCWFSNTSYKRITYKYDGPTDDHGKKKKKDKKQSPLPQLPPPKDYVPSTYQHHLPLSGTNRSEDRPLIIGDYIRPTMPIGMIESGWLGKAMSFYQNGDVEVYFPIRQMSKRIPAIYLERVIPTPLKVED